MGAETELNSRLPNDELTDQHLDGVGISVGGFFVSASMGAATQESLSVFPKLPSGHSIPPSALLPRLQGEPVRIDDTSPPHPRGTGGFWPPESTLNMGEQGGRFPLAYALKEFAEGQELPPWRWTTPEMEQRGLTSTEAIAASVANAVSSIPSPRGPIAVVIPNHCAMLQQQQLIDACRLSGCEVKLLWRPVAAALVWSRTIGQKLLDIANQSSNSLGTLLCIHLGVDHFEVSTLELRREFSGEAAVLLSARRRPSAALRPYRSWWLDVIHSVVANGSLSHIRPGMSMSGSQSAIWSKLWASDWQIDLATRLTLDKYDLELAREVRRHLQKVMDGRDGSTSSMAIWNGDRLRQGKTLPDLNQHKAEIAEELGRHQIVGAVVTGELASITLNRTETYAEAFLSDLQLALPKERVLIDDVLNFRHSLLAEGAALYSTLIATGQRTYLDTLPRIQMAAYVTGTPGWLPLLSETDEYVDGGRVWRRPNEISGLRALSGTDRLEMTLSHEEFETARKISAHYPRSLPSDVEIKLKVSVEPAQGNARVEVIPGEAEALGAKRIFLEWRKMEVLSQKPKEWLEENLPTLFPACLKRAASLTLWKKASVQIQHYLELVRPGQHHYLQLKNALLDRGDSYFSPKPNEEAKATAVSSDGVPGYGTVADVDLFVSRALETLKKPLREGDSNLIRAIAYTSTANADFAIYLHRQLEDRKRGLTPEILAACGWCLRDPKSISMFASRFDVALQYGTSGKNNWLKSFGEMLRYREDATAEIPTFLCEKLTSIFLGILGEQLVDGNIQIVFRNAALCLTFLLRRRAFDDDYLSPDSTPYKRARRIFSEALARLPQVSGSQTINQRKIVKLMLDYLDRKGPPVLSGGSELRKLVD